MALITKWCAFFVHFVATSLMQPTFDEVIAPQVHPNPFTLFKDLNEFIRDLTEKRFYNIQSSKNPPLSVDGKEPTH